MKNKPRYSRISDILDLAIFMQSKSQGVTLNDISNRYNVSRRTAERMRDSLLDIFPSIDTIETSDNQKHWGFNDFSIKTLITFDNNETNKLENLINKHANNELKNQLTKTIEKLKILNSKKILSNEENFKLLMQHQGYAIRQMPEYKINPEILKEVQNALMQNKKLKGIYHNKERLLEPLGIIYGAKTYLIAYEKEKGEETYTYTLHKFENLKMTNETFKKHDFNLQEFANRSFGVFHGEILNVELIFSTKIAEKALNYHFHPTQKMKKNKDGTLTVNFKASGEREIIYNIFRWGTECKILKPLKLKQAYMEYLDDVLKNYNNS